MLEIDKLRGLQQRESSYQFHHSKQPFQAGGVQWLFSAQGGGGVRVRADLTRNILLTMEQQFNNAVIMQPSCLALRDLTCTRLLLHDQTRNAKHPQPQKTSGFFA